ncbi:MAG: CHASE3 domain-containing protein [Pseudomonadota bacterium]|jgi:signal transduction histidine kinase/CHASE3 domain sensor protein/ActR/RegA family two-component response regulator|nr:CHASE3 domain-containing protein [Pseudomonadota bacterium]
MRWTTERKTQLAFACALACVVLIGVVSVLSLQRLRRDAAWVTHTVTVLADLRELQDGIETAESDERDFLITQSPADLRGYRQAAHAIESGYGQLKRQTADNPLEQHRLVRLAPLLAARIAGLSDLLALRREQGFRAAQRQQVLAREHRSTAEQIDRIIGRMRTTERTLLAGREATAAQRAHLTEQTVAGGGALAFIITALALWALRRDFAGRRRAETAVRQLNAELENRVIQRTDELARANASVQASERRLRAFVSTTSDVVYQIAPDWSELRAQRADRDGGAPPVATTDWLERFVHPEDRERVRAAVAEALRTGGVLELEHRVRRSDGSVGWVVSRAVPLKDGADRVVEWFGAASDVTERKEARLKLEAQLARLNLLDSITRAMGERQDVHSIFQVVIRTLEAHLALDFCSICRYDGAAHRLIVARVGAQSGALALELALGENVRIDIGQNGLSRCVQGELVYEPDLAALDALFPRRLAAGGLGSLVAAPLRFESQVFGVLLAARREPRSFSSGECEFLRQLAEHVALAAQQTQLHEALQRAYDDLRQTQQAVLQQERLLALGTMASGIAHDINNAISPIMLYTDMLLEDREVPSRAHKPLQVIQRAVEQVAHTVARMREFYRVREPQQRLTPVDLNQLVADVLDLTRARWSDMPQQRGVVIELQTELQPDLPRVPGVASELRDALTNLVFNAVDAMPQGGRLRLQTRLLTPAAASGGARGYVQLAVNDSGVGMDEETRSRCLEPFYTTKGERGTGLGLPMVYGAMQRHGGEVEVASVLGKGTCVTLSFPVMRDDAGSVTGIRPVEVVPPRRILLVDDDPIVMQSTRETLSADGHAVTIADGGQAGIDAFRRALSAGQPYDVVITDLGMPQVDGRQVAAAVKSARAQTLVLLLTGWGRRLVEEGEIPPHVDRVLTKPPRLHELRAALVPLGDAPAA